jgi:hypothetical protein
MQFREYKYNVERVWTNGRIVITADYLKGLEVENNVGVILGDNVIQNAGHSVKDDFFNETEFAMNSDYHRILYIFDRPIAEKGFDTILNDLDVTDDKILTKKEYAANCLFSYSKSAEDYVSSTSCPICGSLDLTKIDTRYAKFKVNCSHCHTDFEFFDEETFTNFFMEAIR